MALAAFKIGEETQDKIVQTTYGANRPPRNRINPLPEAVSAPLSILVRRCFVLGLRLTTFMATFKACARVILPVFLRLLIIRVSIFHPSTKHFYHDVADPSTTANQYNSQAHSPPPQLSTPPTIMSRASRVNRPRAEVSGAPG